MARSYRKTPALGASDVNNNCRRLRRRARRTNNRRKVRELLKNGRWNVNAINEAADGLTYQTAQEADGSYWGHGYFGHLLTPGDPNCWFTHVQAPKLIRK